MRTAFAYTTARILLFVVSTVLLYLVGARGFLLLILACLVSALASYVLLSKQRDRISGSLTSRLGKGAARSGQPRMVSFRARLEEGARAEDEDEDEPAATADEPAATTSQRQ
jgi:uncharacterized protein (DUF58 family)